MFLTPQDAEDAFYDAMDERDSLAMSRVWLDSADSLCLLPMRPVVSGHAAIMQIWSELFQQINGMDVSVRHIQWIEYPQLAMHVVEERVAVAGSRQPSLPVYALNVYRQQQDGWRLCLHQNSPLPPPEMQTAGH